MGGGQGMQKTIEIKKEKRKKEEANRTKQPQGEDKGVFIKEKSSRGEKQAKQVTKRQ